MNKVVNIESYYEDNRDKRVVIIDDQSIGRKILESIAKKISHNIKVLTFSDPNEALEECRATSPDLLITDYRMPTMDGIEVIRNFRSYTDCSDVPIVMVTIIEDQDVRYRALEAGATDFLSRPFDHYECQARCTNLLKLYAHQKADRSRAQLLERKIAQATANLKLRELDALHCLAKAGEFRDECTGSHIYRMSHYSAQIARALGFSNEQIDHILRAAPMHDIGKIGVPDNILLKPGPLTDKERKIMEQHPKIGHDILSDSESDYLKIAAKIALSHHERYDGSGYPYGLIGTDIPIEARIVSVADVLDALSSNRPYKSSWSLEESFAYIANNAETQFDPSCVRALLNSKEEIYRIFNNAPDSQF